MGIHDQLCLRRRPQLAVWGTVLFTAFGILEFLGRHHQFATTIVSRMGYLGVTVCFPILLAKARCAIERLIFGVLSAISAVAFCASLLGVGTFVAAKLTIMCGWFAAAAACGFWVLYSRRHRPIDSV
jgi:hypothetical protein